jgi:hypothetical protein
MLPLLGFPAFRHVPERWTRRFAGRPAPQRAASGVWVPPSRRPPPSLPVPFGPGASLGFTLQGLLLEPMGIPLGTPALVSFLASVRRAPLGSGRTRTASGPRSRLELVLHPDPQRDPARRCLPGLFPSRAFPSPAPAFRFGSRSLPSHAFERHDVQVRRRLRVFGHGGIGWSLSGLPALLGFRHLATVAAPLRSARGAGSWFRLTDRARCRRLEPIHAPSRPNQPE